MKFIHTSDWHINNSFSKFPHDKKEALKKRRWDAIKELCDYAKNNQIDLILVGGDQFDDGFNASSKDLQNLFNLIKSYEDITFIMIAGNHDPYTNGSVYKKIEKAPFNLQFITDKEEIYLQDKNCKIFAASLTSKNGRNNPLEWVEAEDEDCLRIGLAHGSLKIEGKYNPEDFPIDLDFAEKKKLDYLALGHYHTFYQNNNSYYCGTIEQMQPHDTYYALLVELEKNKKPEITKIPLNFYLWEQKEFNITDNNIDSLFNDLKKYSENTILELKVSGYLSYENYNRFTEQLKEINLFQCFLDNQINIKPTEEEIKNLDIKGYLENIIKEIYFFGNDNILQEIKNNFLKESDLNIENSKIIDEALLKIYDFFKNKVNK